MALQQQQAFVVDLIEQVKRKRARKRQGPFEGTSSDAFNSNRGNKFRRNAKYTERGRLDNPFGASTYKQEIDYNGYKRSIISRNPPLYDADGDLVDDEDEVGEGAASPYEENIYKDIRLEETLQPLTAASDLPTHPSLSHPYYDRGLPEMIRNTEEMLQAEQRTLWKLKQLFTQLRGDSVWAPVGVFHDEYDDWMLEDGVTNGEIPETFSMQEFASHSGANGSEGQAHPGDLASTNGLDAGAAATNGIGTVDHAADTKPSTIENDLQNEAQEKGSMTVIEEIADSKGSVLSNQMQRPPHTNGAHTNGIKIPAEDGDQEMEDAHADETIEEIDPLTTINQEDPPQRMTTRAQTRSTPPPDLTLSRSPSPTATASTAIHPIYTFPIHARPDFNLGLPPNLADETRAILLNYVSKQEEVVRQLHNLHQGLLRGQRMRRHVLKWCKAEGHVGELSDGEDWYDLEEWGLQEGELVKGREEEEDDGGQAAVAGGGGGGSKKTRRAGKEKN